MCFILGNQPCSLWKELRGSVEIMSTILGSIFSSILLFQIIFLFYFLFCVCSHVHQTITISHILSEDEEEKEEEEGISNQQPLQYPFLEGFPTTENSWFPGLVLFFFSYFIFRFDCWFLNGWIGYAWQIAYCSQCGNHLGWKFRRTRWLEEIE